MRNPKRCKGLELLEFWQTTKKGWKTKRDQVGTEASSGLSWNPGQVNIGNILKALQNFPTHDKNLSKPGLQQSEGLLNVPFQPLGLSRGKVARLSPLNQMWLLRGAAASALGETIKFKQFKMKHPMLDLRVAQVGSADDSKWPQIFFFNCFLGYPRPALWLKPCRAWSGPGAQAGFTCMLKNKELTGSWTKTWCRFQGGLWGWISPWTCKNTTRDPPAQLEQFQLRECHSWNAPEAQSIPGSRAGVLP